MKGPDARECSDNSMNPHFTTSLPTAATISHDVSEGNINGACKELVAHLGFDCVISDSDILRSRSSTPWSPAPPSQYPAKVVTPRTTADVSQIMKICSRRRVPVTAFSGGTSFYGALSATRRGICIDFKLMDQILAIHERDLDVVLQPAVDWQDLNARLEPLGMFFPPDPGAGARIGGMIAMSCSGTNAYRHGTMRDWVTSMTVVLADGSIVKTRQRPRKSSAGYDLSSLLVGSEGTLGLVTEAVIKITSLPQNQHVGLAAFLSTRAAVSTAISLITSGLPIDALELLDPYSLGAINHSGLSSRQWEEKPTLFLRFSGSSQAVQDQIQMAREAAATHGCKTFETSGNRQEIDVIWGARKQVGPSLVSMKQDPTDVFMSADAAVPISALADMIDWTHSIIKEAGFIGSTLGHVGDGESPRLSKLWTTLTALGNYHTAIICRKAEEVKAWSVIESIQRRAIQLEGTITGEHGIGLKLRDMLVEEVGDNSIKMMRAVTDLNS
ncbi:MAG: hypothetical protein LQ341_005909 [Variospora aurantia]|nr:MAG: hypothetical protein LQ341_005909 [Variospora aurantia]